MLLCQRRKKKHEERRQDSVHGKGARDPTEQGFPGIGWLQLRAWALALPCSSVPSVLIKPFSERTDSKPYGTIQGPICKFPGHFMLFFPPWSETTYALAALRVVDLVFIYLASSLKKMDTALNLLKLCCLLKEVLQFQFILFFSLSFKLKRSESGRQVFYCCVKLSSSDQLL